MMSFVFVACMMLSSLMSAAELALLQFQRDMVSLQDASAFTIKSLDAWYALHKDTVPEKDNSEKHVISKDVFVLEIKVTTEAQKKIMGSQIAKSFEATQDEAFLYAEARVIDPQSTIFCWGDLHGDIRALVHMLYALKKSGVLDDAFKVTNEHPHTYFVFCGDFTDRGKWSIEVCTVLSILKQQNPERVIIVRGNHEDKELNEKYGLLIEVIRKFKKDFEDLSSGQDDDGSQLEKALTTFFKELTIFYNSLPAVLFMGTCFNKLCNFIQFCHGGLDLFDLSSLLRDVAGKGSHHSFSILEGSEQRTVLKDTFIKSVPSAEEKLFRRVLSPGTCQYLWSDFDPFQVDTWYQSGRGVAWGSKLVTAILDFYTRVGAPIKAVFRAHQHNDSMPGLMTPQNTGMYRISTVTKYAVFTTTSMGVYKGFFPTYLKIDLNGGDPAKWMLTAFSYQRLAEGVFEAVSRGPLPLLTWANVKN